MNLPSFLTKQTPLEMGVMLMFVLYLILPIETPDMLAFCIDSTMGYLSMFLLGLYLFKDSSKLLAVLFLFVAYELINRSCKVTKKQQADAVVRPIHSENAKKTKMVAMNPKKEVTLEEEVVEVMAPIGKSDLKTYLKTSFNPVANDTKGASKV